MSTPVNPADGQEARKLEHLLKKAPVVSDVKPGNLTKTTEEFMLEETNPWREMRVGDKWRQKIFAAALVILTIVTAIVYCELILQTVRALMRSLFPN